MADGARGSRDFSFPSADGQEGRRTTVGHVVMGVGVEEALKWPTRFLVLHSLLVLASGIWLVFFYQPTAAQAWNDIAQLQSEIAFGLQVRRAHRFLSWAWLVTIAVVAVVAAVKRFSRRAATFAFAAGFAFVAGFSGRFLPWDQLALFGVTAGTNIDGFEPILTGDQVRFVLIDGAERSVSSLRRWFVVHLFTGILAVVLVATTAFGRRTSTAD